MRASALREVVEAAEHPQVLAPGQVLVDGRVLAGEADRLAHRLRLAEDVEAGDACAAGVRLQQRRQDADRRRLARSVRPQQAEDGAFLHLEVDAVEGAHLALARAVDLDESFGFDGGHAFSAYAFDLDPRRLHALGRYNVRMARIAILLALLVPAGAVASDGALLAAKERFLPAAQSDYANTPDGAQARYDAGRDLVEAVLAAGPVTSERRALRADLLARGRAQVARAEALDRDDGFRSAAPLAPLPSASAGHGPRRPDPTLARRLAAAAARVNGAAGIWVHDLSTGRYAGYEADTRFAAASTVKLGALAAGAAPLAAAGAQPVVVRRAPDRLLVVEPRREPDLGRPRLRLRSATGCGGSA